MMSAASTTLESIITQQFIVPFLIFHADIWDND